MLPTTTGDGDHEVFRPPEAAQRKKQKMSSSCRRFGDEQIKSMESVFKKEKKLEPRKKVEMARELGLQPRQVAIWFQNRRARWKSKQVEQDYTNLKADYDTLNHRFQSLKKEKHDLLHQLSNLCSQLKEGEAGSKDLGTSDDNLLVSSEETHDDKANNNFELQMDTLFDGSCSNWWDIWS